MKGLLVELADRRAGSRILAPALQPASRPRPSLLERRIADEGLASSAHRIMAGYGLRRGSRVVPRAGAEDIFSEPRKRGDRAATVHGGQQLRLFNAHYDDYGFQPIVVLDEDGRFVTAVLRPAKRRRAAKSAPSSAASCGRSAATGRRWRSSSAPTATTLARRSGWDALCPYQRNTGFNRRRAQRITLGAERLLGIAIMTPPRPFWKIVGRPRPHPKPQLDAPA